MNTKEAAAALIGELKRLAGPMFASLAAELRAELADQIKALPPSASGEKGDPGPPGRNAPTLEELGPVVEREVANMAPAILERLVRALPPAPPGEKGDPGPRGHDGPTLEEIGGTVTTEVARVAPTLLREIVDALPHAEPGKPGKKGDPGPRGDPGRDGIGLPEVRAAVSEIISKELPELVKVGVAAAMAALPILLYKGVWQEDQTYEPGNTATWAGSLWHCNESTRDKPGTSGAWTLIVKRGRDGKDYERPAERRP